MSFLLQSRAQGESVALCCQMWELERSYFKKSDCMSEKVPNFFLSVLKHQALNVLDLQNIMKFFYFFI